MKSLSMPLILLCALLAAALLNGAYLSRETDRWSAQLALAEDAGATENWPKAKAALAAAYADWSRCQTYLHVVSEHDLVDGAEAMYRRAAAFAQAREPSEFQAELSGLQTQLHLLAERERISLRNIL